MFLFSHIIMLGGLRTNGLVDNALINIEGTKRGLEKSMSFIRTKNL